MSQQAQILKFKRYVWTGAFAAVTATGAWYGAGLKTTQDRKKAVQKVHEISIDEKLAVLNEQRAALVTKRIGLQRKIDELEARRNGATRAESRAGLEQLRK